MSKTYVLKSTNHSARRPSGVDYRKELNDAQYQAATLVEGPLLIVAGAGTGKTRTLVYRVAHLVDVGVDPRSILLLTFTRRAAEEMLRRASLLVDKRCSEVAGGTFHSFANVVLRQLGRHVQLPPSFTIMDRSDTEDALQLLRTEMGLHQKERRFPRKQTVAEIFSTAVNKQTSVPDLVERDYPHLLESLDDLVRLQERYRAYKEAKALVDYDDLLIKLRDLLRQREDICCRLSERYRFLMVDEYQDTNPLQAEIIRLLAATHDNVAVVGDDAQSIYSFRGADFRNIMDFPKAFPGTRIIKLEENYRSTQPILDLTNEIIRRARERYEKRLYTRKRHGAVPLLVQAESEQMQSRFVCQKILELREEGVPLWDIAVLFRSSFHSFDLELELARHNIPFIKRGGFQFMETTHIKDLLAHLRVLANPRDSISWNRVLLLLEGVGPQMSQKIGERLIEEPQPFEALRSFPAKDRVAHGLKTLAQVLQAAASAERPAEQTQYLMQYYAPLLKRTHPDDYPKRLRDLEHFQGITERYRSLERLLSDMALEPPTDSVAGTLAVDPDEGPLVLSTIHSAKGLEWHSVFIIWALEGRFPSFYNMNSEEELEEERRLLYVAATRAKENLFISYPIKIFDRGLRMVLSRPSQFIEGISEDLLEPVTVVDEERSWGWE
ncbi:MAG TPA: ATP-dependent helicase [candidate division Zixibacteria bacterium]|nr:ATP-dependent helicase [candidate division Zixibacteria bacterium]